MCNYPFNSATSKSMYQRKFEGDNTLLTTMHPQLSLCPAQNPQHPQLLPPSPERIKVISFEEDEKNISPKARK